MTAQLPYNVHCSYTQDFHKLYTVQALCMVQLSGAVVAVGHAHHDTVLYSMWIPGDRRELIN